MRYVEPLEERHFDSFVLQDEQSHFMEAFEDPKAYMAMLATYGDAFAVVCRGKTVCIAGLFKVWEGRSILWSLISKEAGPDMWYIIQCAKRLMDNFGEKRIEATVDCNFKNGHRFIKILGFKCEAERMIGFEPDGRDCSLYAKVKV